MTPAAPRIWLAPLRGLTGALFRNVYAEHFDGIDGAVTPFLTTIQGVRIKPSQIQEVLPDNNRHIPAVPQIISKTPSNFIALATALHRMGYDTVNWNLGCPFARVAKKQRGSGLLPHPERIDAFLDQVAGALPTGICIKLRLGRSDPGEILDLLPIFDRYPIQSLIIHPRTGEQMYTGRPDLEMFAQCLQRTRHPVIYNGDIVDRKGFEMLQQRFPSVAGWMIGRGLLADPFLPSEIKGSTQSHEERIGRFRRFHDTLFDRFGAVRHGPVQLVDTMKGYWTYFAQNFQQGDKLLKSVRKTRRVEQYRELMEIFWKTAAFKGTPDACGSST